jgi:membrane protein YqaA with SNARE-associated domain
MHEFLTQHGYPALFLLSFLASTLIPLGSEWLLVALLLQRYDPVTTVLIASAGNYLGGCTSYGIGLWGGPWLIRKLLQVDEATEQRAAQLYARYGSWSLLFSWLPVVGDPLCLVGGILEVGFARFSLLVFSGKLARYAAVAWLTLTGVTVMNQ